jgi:hypothetical protein
MSMGWKSLTAAVLLTSTGGDRCASGCLAPGS